MIFLTMTFYVLWILLGCIYPHAPHEEGLRSWKEILEEYKDRANFKERNIPNENLLDLARLIRENNYFF